MCVCVCVCVCVCACAPVCLTPACRVVILSTGCSGDGLKAYCLFGHCWINRIVILRRLKPSPFGFLLKSFQ